MLNNLGRYSVKAGSEGTALMKRSGPTNPRGFVTTALTATGLTNRTGGGFSTTGSSIQGNYSRSVVHDFLNPDDDSQINPVYRDIYYHDTIGGSAVDLLSTLPWSDFTLTGLPDSAHLKAYAQSCENLNVKSLFPEISVDYLAMGKFIGVLNFDNNERLFTSIMPQNVDFCEITELPLYGMDPLIDVRVPKELQDLLKKAKTDRRMQGMIRYMPDFVIEQAQKGRIQLNPANTLYLPRRTFSTTSKGTSFYRRLLAVYTLEKALLRGTIESAYRRQRGILHLVAGDDEWEPTGEELNAITNMFISADTDPTGAVVATRAGIEVNEVRNGSDFWRYDEIYDFLTTAKMKALGINDSFLNGDATYNTMETALSVFIEQLRSFREMIVRRTFMTKIFPAIAVANDFKRNKARHEVTSAANIDGMYEIICAGNSYVPDMNDINITDYNIPRVNWHKALKPEADQEYLQVLSTLTEQGVPIPLRAWAAAGGLSLTEIMNSLDEDVKLRKKMDDYKKKLPKSPTDEVNEMLSSFVETGSVKSGQKKNRNFEEIETRDPQTGKVLSRKGRTHMDNRNNKNIATALSNLAQIDNKRENENQKKSRKKTYSYSMSNPSKGPFGNVG